MDLPITIKKVTMLQDEPYFALQQQVRRIRSLQGRPPIRLNSTREKLYGYLKKYGSTNVNLEHLLGRDHEHEVDAEDEVSSEASSRKELKTWSFVNKKEWLLTPTEIEPILTSLLSLLENQNITEGNVLRILVPGVGYSSIGLHLVSHIACDCHITLTDVDEDALDYQRSLFRDIRVKPTIVTDNLLKSTLPCAAFHFIIDSSVSDVFIRQHHGQRVLHAFDRLLAPGGIVLSISMFHKPWKRLCPRNGIWYAQYGYVPHFIRSRRQLASHSGGIPRPIAVLVLRHKVQNRHRDEVFAHLAIPSLELTSLHDLKADDMQRGAEDF